MHLIAPKSRQFIPPSESLLHDIDGMFDGLFALRRHGWRPIRRQDRDRFAALGDDDLFAAFGPRKQIGKLMIGLAGSDSFHSKSKSRTGSTIYEDNTPS